MIDACTRYCAFLQELTPETLHQLGDYLSDDVHFTDPFNNVCGRESMMRVFQNMFKVFGTATFTILNRSCDGHICMLSWRFAATLRGRPWVFDGMSTVRFGSDGKVIEHLDHWDAAGAFYEKLPIIGWLLAAIRQRLRVE